MRVSDTHRRLGAEIGELVDHKSASYSNGQADSCQVAGDMLYLLFPDGVEPEQYGDMLLLVRIIDKMIRVANGNEGDESAWKDIAGYALRAEAINCRSERWKELGGKGLIKPKKPEES